MTDTPHYPAIAFLVSYGRLLALAVGVVLAAGGIIATLLDYHWIWAVVGIGGGGLAWLLLRSYAEVVTVISETLLPQ